MKYFKFDTHVHTSETSPCGKVDAKTVVQLYKKAGYHGIVITDHYIREYFEGLPHLSWNQKIDEYLKGYFTALEEGRKTGLRVLLGIELRFDENSNDYLVYGFDPDFLYRNPKLYEMGLKNFRKLIENTPILLYQAHPFRPMITPAEPQYLHGVEVYNGNPRHNSYNEKAYEYAEKYGLKMLAGSDFHQMQDTARGGIALGEAPENSRELAEMLSENKIIEFITTP
ncbi:PHP domain protein [Thermoclostridium stercorarium subsp. stercorarium DSM 8532]|jgi:predicted metal-dependent phosphoesterase TrpH|uniref:PHP domain protein n=3 Tax=Thermoclostridium stercorarium TaxID=1510 RepID=L7VLI0_THES1|nr:PHP domain-containing protein [Thermoclostridium stercorarium]AGC67499.1 PHP domain protein [Thermoclostridium stercorarium subsp. stercorarium DSM 8532]AGI38554.1 phosphoesterase [Thermoclostridium stercorarium subsp. stercorarium DSM 8532]ANW97926.1 transposase [Thermoclostridium stercorarium subsp. thermolacticum DSM 2910]ANX00476.1 transposase [Thermoclostridium stercorarium subsp. leptospartum DSM 9219]UZQ86084.1 PHP domain-containing protein [Thermoclostridium stercorarium]